ncbi:MAG: class I SAM-dependent methyltransferase [Gammaproteobacteria bacterium]|nr:class I SAM-dependent methyltransferase [Gammaproteobacteria bacterium]MDH5261578.1 class I SAM-dependent methyltransferase [Gammaproteobacteria bacterium]
MGLECEDLLEVGYGSGVFFPHLRTVSERLSGIDPHTCEEQVRRALQSIGIDADLKSGSVASMPFADLSFDVIVAVSALEYVDAIDDACREMTRVLRPNGSLVVVTPCKSPILDFGLRIVGGEDAESNYGARREKLFSSLVRHFDIDALAKWPWPGVPGLTVYRALRLTPKTK